MRRRYTRRRLFLRACLRKNYAKVRALLPRILDVDVLHRGNNALNLLREPTPGREDEHIDVVRELLRRGCDPNHNEDGPPMLLHLCDVSVRTVPGDAILRYRDKLVELLRILLGAGADPNHRHTHRAIPVPHPRTWSRAMADGTTALSASADPHSFEELGLELLDHGIDFENPGNRTLLTDACFSGKIRLVKKMIAKGASLYALNRWEETALMCACGGGNEEVAHYLMDLYEEAGDHQVFMFRRGPDFDPVTFLEEAQRAGLGTVVSRGRALLETLDLSIPTVSNDVPERVQKVIRQIEEEEQARSIWRVRIVELCEQYEATIDEYEQIIQYRHEITAYLRERMRTGLRIYNDAQPGRSSPQISVLQYIQNRPIEEVELELLTHPTDLEVRYPKGRTLLMVACYHHQGRLLQRLIDLGADIHPVDEDGDTTLTVLATDRGGPVPMIEGLITLYETRGSLDYILRRNHQGYGLVELAHLRHLTGPLHRLRSLYRRILVTLTQDPTSGLYGPWQGPQRSLDVLGIVAEYLA